MDKKLREIANLFVETKSKGGNLITWYKLAFNVMLNLSIKKKKSSYCPRY